MIINRELDISEKRVGYIQPVSSAIATGVTTFLSIIPYNGLVDSCFATAFGLSGAPTVSFSLYRFLSTGFTAIGLGATITVPAFGTSGVLAATLAGGVTCLQGDLLVALSGAANAAVAGGLFGAVVRATDDYVKFPGC